MGHLGSEHRSAGQYDETGKSPHLAGHPVTANTNGGGHRLAGEMRYGYACQHYDASDPKFTTEYDWQHCVDMHVGETYEVHWPHSSAGECPDPILPHYVGEWQYQTPFYDGVFCNPLEDAPIPAQIGVEGQVFTIIN